MRTTLKISDDVLFAAKAVARRERRTTGDVLSTWARVALHRPEQAPGTLAAETPLARYGIHPLPPRGGVVTNDLVKRLRDEDGS